MNRKKTFFCCDAMHNQIEYTCEQHPDPHECPDKLIAYTRIFDEYGLVIHDGGSASALINFCPWCGIKLPNSRRDEWFDRLEKMGFHYPLTDNTIPSEFKTDAWYQKT